jgi:peptidoglycan hydrolase-like amidase
MWRDIGLRDWLFNLDEASEIPGIVPAVLALAKYPEAAKAKAIAARTFVARRQRDTMQTLAESV